ncbi:MAG: hypothetical protein WCK58_18130 [Chloroflexota bacterium]
MHLPRRHQLAAVFLGAALVIGTAAPAAAPGRAVAATRTPAVASSGQLPPDASAMRTPGTAVIAAPDALKRLGTLRVRALGIYKSVYDWGCRGPVVPNYVLSWHCKSSNNRFLTGHAYGVFHPIWTAYKYHRLKVGMIATFTTAGGTVTKFKLAWVRKVPKSYLYNGITGERWAWGSTSLKALTLQTCWGSTNAYRLVLRFYKV